MTRLERNRKRKAVKRSIMILFMVVVPAAAIAASVFFMNIYNRGNAAEASVKASTTGSVTAFKYKSEIKEKSVYRVEFGDYKSFEEAEAFIKSIKAKKLNGFIVKEDGYKVIYGAFLSGDEAGKVKDSIVARAACKVTEIKLPGYSLNYNEADNTFIQLVKAADKLIWDVAGAKSMLSLETAVKSKKDPAGALDLILNGESKLEKYLGYAEEINVPRELKDFRENFEMLLKDVLSHRLGSERDYYRLQESLMNQVEAYRKFTERLSI